MKGIQEDGIWFNEPKKVKEIFQKHFQDRFKEDTENNWNQDFEGIKRLNEEQKGLLESPFSDEEIKTAVWACGHDKSRGPDGFNVEFLKQFWD